MCLCESCINCGRRYYMPKDECGGEMRVYCDVEDLYEPNRTECDNYEHE